MCHCQNNFHQFLNILGPLRAERQCLVLIIMIIVLQPTAFFFFQGIRLLCLRVCCVRRDVAVIIAVLFLLEQEKKSRLKDFSSFYFFFPDLESRRWRNRPWKRKKISSRCAALVDWCHRRKKLFWNLCESQNKHIPVKMWKGKGNLITIDIIAQGKFNDTLLRRVDIQMRWMRVCVLAVFFFFFFRCMQELKSR